MESGMNSGTGARTWKKKVIVIVDDVRELRQLFTEFLRDQGYIVVDVALGGRALDTVKQHGACLVLLDLMLPDMDGNDVLNQLKQDPVTANVPVMVISAYPRWLKPEQSKQAAHVMRKPFELDELLEAIHTLAGDAYPQAEAS